MQNIAPTKRSALIKAWRVSVFASISALLQFSAKVDVDRLAAAAKIALSATMSGALYFYLSSSSGLSSALAVRRSHRLSSVRQLLYSSARSVK
jgi:hypothetical protein